MYKAKSAERTNEWGTPKPLFENLNWEFRFTLDACASKCNHKVERFFTKEDNALEKLWSGRVWINPPFDKGGLDVWVNKIIKEVTRPESEVEVVVALIPTYNALVNHLCMVHASEIRTVRYHLHFHDTRDGIDYGPCKQAAAFNVNIVVFKNPQTIPQIHSLINEDGLPLSLEDAQSGKRRTDREKKTPIAKAGTKRQFDEDEDDSDEDDEAEEYYEVERLLKRRYNEDGRTEYLVLWKDYSTADATWIDESDITDDLIQDYNKQCSNKRICID
jgi:site-specific DNA-methyltransferase (adenine-specific)